MPVAQGTKSPARQALMVGLGAAGGVLVVLFLVTQMGNLLGSADVSVPVGKPLFQVGQADEMAAIINEDGPLLLPDATGGVKDIWIQHLGDETDSGWHAFAARPIEAPQRCYVEWEASTSTFVDNCDGQVYPEDGDGLEQFSVSVTENGTLTVNLNSSSSS